MYSVLAVREKGALGLLFEMNVFLGFGLIIWIMVKVFGEAPPEDEHFMKLHNWLFY